ncbi:metal-dependent hydrolase [Ligilactobacillus acidipiscis]|uniref:metal-dependent hydrolase n=1 Tax=Ligilactobacillus acidipiscis TaxID=89059 RepID=UPI0023F67783|nr:metal-dependent hydrolase [Ligilactobacillus acidipiscis]WEV56356.1 metal-dependent hydrolase [Ligilactobacillus acidipiscis]
MEYKTHLVSTVVVGLPVMASGGQVDVLNMGMLVLGSLLPDIDHPQSFLGKRNKIASGLTNKAFGHRKATHSLAALVLVYWLMSVIAAHYLTSRGIYTPFWLTFGYLCHLLEDSFSRDGVNWLWPKKRKATHGAHQVVFYKTGGLGEYLVLGLMICLLVIEIRLLWIGQLDRLLAGKYLTNLQTWLFSLDQFLPFIK